MEKELKKTFWFICYSYWWNPLKIVLQISFTILDDGMKTSYCNFNVCRAVVIVLSNQCFRAKDFSHSLILSQPLKEAIIKNIQH